MNNIALPQKRKWLSNIILIAFTVLICAIAFLSDALKIKPTSQNQFIEQTQVFKQNELNSILKLTLKNKAGVFSFERKDTAENSPWNMTEPKDLSANSVFVDKLFKSLNTIKTIKILANNTTNNSNFSLENPTTTLTLVDLAGNSLLLSIGIMNTIDNSTYLKISGRDGIYHVEAPSISLENVTIADLVKSSVFDFDISKIMHIKIFKKNLPVAQLDAEKKNGEWLTKEGQKLNSSPLENAIIDILNLKSSLILEDQTDAQKNVTLPLLNNADYKIEITNDDNQTYSYKVCTIKNPIPNISLNDLPHFIMSEKQSPTIHIVKLEFLNLFELKSNSFSTEVPKLK